MEVTRSRVFFVFEMRCGGDQRDWVCRKERRGGIDWRGEHNLQVLVRFDSISERASIEDEADMIGLGDLAGSPPKDTWLMACIIHHWCWLEYSEFGTTVVVTKSIITTSGNNDQAQKQKMEDWNESTPEWVPRRLVHPSGCSQPLANVLRNKCFLSLFAASQGL